MRALSLMIVATALVGCKGDERSPTPAPAPSATGATPQNPRPSLTEPTGVEISPPPPAVGFDDEVEDKDWATNTERAIAAVAPELSDVECRRTQCRASMTGGTQEELVAKAAKLSSEEGIRSIDGARSVLMSGPETVNGKLTMKLYIEYDR